MGLSIISLGRYLLLISLLTALYGIVAAAIGGYRQDVRYARSANRAVLGTVGTLFAAAGCLWYLLLTSNFEVQYVWQYTDTHLSPFLRFSAFWAGQKGSLLLWAVVLGGYVLAFMLSQRKYITDPMTSYSTSVALGVLAFFLGMLNSVSNPFDRQPTIPFEGNGLNPLLQHPAMIIHPPMLFLGYVGFAIPFAFAMGTMLAGRNNNDWLTRSRSFAMVPWTALTVGIVLGGRWAYEELGWGGYWAWDPVENASFIPWLIGTAYIHSVQIQERKNMLRGWNVTLAAMTFISCILGTYLTRSGVVQSVHSFGVSPLGNFFLVFLVTSILFSVVVIVSRMHLLKSENKLESVFSRESAFLANNVLFLSFAFITLVGTVSPAVVEYFTGQKISVREPFFNKFAIPFGILMLLLTGIGPLISWRSASWSNFSRNFLWPTVTALVSLGVFVAVGFRDPLALSFWPLCMFVLGTVWLEVWRGTGALMRNNKIGPLPAVFRLFTKNRRRYGGYIVHVGIVVITAGIISSSVFQVERDLLMVPGERAEIGYGLRDYSLTYHQLDLQEFPHKETVVANVTVRNETANYQADLVPQKQFFFKGGQPHTEVQTMSSLLDDFYIILTGFEPDGTVNFKVYINPLVSWVWGGTAIILAGCVLALIPRRGRRELATP